MPEDTRATRKWLIRGRKSSRRKCNYIDRVRENHRASQKLIWQKNESIKNYCNINTERLFYFFP